MTEKLKEQILYELTLMRLAYRQLKENGERLNAGLISSEEELRISGMNALLLDRIDSTLVTICCKNESNRGYHVALSKEESERAFSHGFLDDILKKQFPTIYYKNWHIRVGVEHDVFRELILQNGIRGF